ncbi:MAG TPA: DNA polymerase domain-containing protein [Polyangiaceae bacterium]|nr:DNA polymerase domain-containing protein [Polyangiaceae bacterium]
MPNQDEELLFGWDPTPGIVSVWANWEGLAMVWRRDPQHGRLSVEYAPFRPWVLSAECDALPSSVRAHELGGTGELRWLLDAEEGRALERWARSAKTRHGDESLLLRPPEEQYLIASGRTYFRDLSFDQLARLQFDLETTGLDAEVDRIFMVAIGRPDGESEILEAARLDDRGEAELIRRLLARITELDPDVIENHNLHGFDLPFLARRAAHLRVPLTLGRAGPPGLTLRPSARGNGELGADGKKRRSRYSVVGRELIDTMDAVLRHDFSARDLPGHGLKDVARHFGIAAAQRVKIPDGRVYDAYKQKPERVRRYASQDVLEARGLARLLGGATFALARMVPRRYDRLADAGPATGVIDPLLVRAYLRRERALPRHEASDGTPHTGAALHLFASGAASRVVKADVASLYPSLMRQYGIGPSRDSLGALLGLVDRLVSLRLEAKARAKAAAPGSADRYVDEALSAAMKIVVNSAYGYLGAGALTRFSDVHAANEVTRRGRELLDLLCRELHGRGVTLLEADTDGVYFAVPESWSEQDERRAVAEVDALLPERVTLEFEGRYQAMLSHEPKNYALLGYDGQITLRGVAFRSSRSAPFGEAFLTVALNALLRGDLPTVRETYVNAVRALVERRLPTRDVTQRVRLTKTTDEYRVTREIRREPTYEALLNAGRSEWRRGLKVRIYRATGGRAALWKDSDAADPRDYDVDYYLAQLRNTFASRLESALEPETFRAVFDDPLQPSLFSMALREAKPRLVIQESSLRRLTTER